MIPVLLHHRSRTWRRFLTSRSVIGTKKMNLTPEEWKARLTPFEYEVLRKKGTEPAFEGIYNSTTDKGKYHCKGCDTPLFTSETKFQSGCGWPAFYDSIPGTLERHEDLSGGRQRVEIVCKNCGGHMGHVFEGEGYNNPTNERHCVNSVSVKFVPEK